ncbi:hypothetical protein NKH77_06715 [Streptomyces sp. M19]
MPYDLLGFRATAPACSRDAGGFDAHVPYADTPTPSPPVPATGAPRGTGVTAALGTTTAHPGRTTRRSCGTPGRPPRRRVAPAPQDPAMAAALLVVVLVARAAGAFTHLRAFLDYGAGVLSLVSLTATVLWGLAATDRIVLHSDHRLLAQAVHRGLAVAGLGTLALHVWVKVVERRTSTTAAAVPFTDVSQPLLIGLGTLAGYLFVAVAVTGAVRSVFASGGGSARWRSRWWRALHMAAYPAWGAALVHGLKAGRPAAGWVTAGYAVCLLGVAAALAVRARTRGRARRPGSAVLARLRHPALPDRPGATAAPDGTAAPAPATTGPIPIGAADPTRVTLRPRTRFRISRRPSPCPSKPLARTA